MKAKLSMIGILCALALGSPQLFCSSVMAGPYTDGLEAWEQGNYAEAAALLQPLAERGFVEAQYLLAIMHEEGLGASRNPAEAAKWFLIAASRGHADSRYRLGILCAEGRGIPQNHTDAAMWLRSAAGQGHTDARQCVGGLYASGQPIPADCRESIKTSCKTGEYGKVLSRDHAAASKGNTPAASSCETECESSVTPQFQQMDLAGSIHHHHLSGSPLPNN